MQRLRTNSTVRTCFSVFLGLAGLILAVGASAQAPVNDDFENAADLGSGPAGTIVTNNLEATRQSGESLVYPTAGGSSIWFKWTAPVDCVVFFDTTNSEIDTVLGVYTGFAVDNLTLIAKNDDFGFKNANTLVQSSRVTFNAVANTEYLIDVDCHDLQGNITLNWGPPGGGPGSLSGGDFRFTSQFYLVGQNESVPPKGGQKMQALSTPTRLTVTRRDGSRGRVFVDYYVTNGIYTNQTTALVATTNITTTRVDTNGNLLGTTFVINSA